MALPAYEQTQRVRADFLRRVTELEAGATQELARHYIATLDRIATDVTKRLEAQGVETSAVRDLFAASPETAHLTILRGRAQYITDELHRFAGQAATITADLPNSAYRLGIRHATNQIGALGGSFVRPNQRMIEHAIAQYQSGTAHAAYWDGFARTSGTQITDRITQGVVMGEHPSVIEKAIRGQADIAQPRLHTAVQTQVMGAARSAAASVFRENADVVTAWYWLSTEDDTTCEVCWAMNGSVWPIDEELDSHPNCRCDMVPTGPSLEQVAGLASDTAPAPGSQMFDPDEAFQRTLSPDQQLAVLGPGKYQMYRDGQIRLADLVQRTSHPVWGPGRRATTLRELRGTVPVLPPIDQVAGAQAAQAVEQAATIAHDIALDPVESLFDITGGAVSVRKRISDALNAINNVHGVRSDTTWKTAERIGRAKRFAIGEERGKIPIRILRRSLTGEGGYFESVTSRKGAETATYPVQIVARPHEAGGMLDYEAVIGHEFGHYVDTVLMPRIAGVQTNSGIAWRMATGNADEITLGMIDDRELAEAFAEVFRQAINTDTFDMLQSIASDSVRTYMTTPDEMFARIYAQWVAERGGSAAMRDAVNTEISHVRSVGMVRGLFAWRHEEFAPIGEAMDHLFRVAGMAR